MSTPDPAVASTSGPELLPPSEERKHVHSLNLSGRDITELPPEIGEMTNLTVLDVSGNYLESLPPAIGRLRKLRVLNVSKNELTALPASIGRLVNLEWLNASENCLRELPDQIVNLVNIEGVIVRANEFRSLSPRLAELPKLEKLDVSYNRLDVLPTSFTELVERGVMIDFIGNPSLEQIAYMAARDVSMLLDYLRSLDDATPIYETKMLLVGEGEVGKTSLAAALGGGTFVENRPTTHGIEVSNIEVAHPTRSYDSILIRCWDFGGQEVYRITHQFFFSPHALYLLVWNSRKGQDQCDVEGWLRRIRLRIGPAARVVVVATHAAARRPELDYPTLAAKYGDILVGQHSVENSAGDGMPQLLDLIGLEAAELPQMGKILSRRWIGARDEILAAAEQDPHITFDDFSDICGYHSVVGPEVRTFAQLLHELGYIVHYGNDEGLQDIVVLDPEWLTKAVSYVLEDGPTVEAKGVLDHSRLPEIWNSPDRRDRERYPDWQHPYFIRLMEKFEISYRLEGEPQRSLVAQLIPNIRPGLPWDHDSSPSPSHRSLRLRCQLSQSADGLLAWLTVRWHADSTGRHWRSGVFLRHRVDAYDSEALVELIQDRQLLLTVRAPSPDFYFNVLRDGLEHLLLTRWPGLTYELLIPCPGPGVGDLLNCLGEFKLRNVLKSRERGNHSMECHECGERRSIAALLTGYDSDLPSERNLDALFERLEDMGGRVGRVENLLAEAAQAIRRVLKAVAMEVSDCPRLFTITEFQRQGAARLKVYDNEYTITLWCEHPGDWHPIFERSVNFTRPREWVVKVAPYMRFAIKTLRFVIPVAKDVAGATVAEADLKSVKNEIDLAKTLVEKIPQVENQDASAIPRSDLSPAEGAALRTFRKLLFEEDSMREFAGLTRVQAPSGDFYWVCPEHYGHYDPGLPDLPTRSG